MNTHKFYIKEAVKNFNQLSSPELVYDEMKELKQSDQESLWVIYVNTKNMFLGKDMISLGGVNSASVDMKILFRRVLLNNAVSFFLIHNHPSGEVDPSIHDINLTEEIKKGAKLLQLKLLDHIIIGNRGYYSFNQKNIL